LSASHVTSAAVPVGLLVDTNLDTSSPDTYRAPPAPLPYDVGLACSQTVPGITENCGNKTDHVRSTDSLPAGETASPDEDLKGFECKSKSDVHASPKVKEDEVSKLKDTNSPAKEEENVCPTCLEGILFSHHILVHFSTENVLHKLSTLHPGPSTSLKWKYTRVKSQWIKYSII